LVVKIKVIRDYNPPRCFQKKISGRSKHNVGKFILMYVTTFLCFISFSKFRKI
jgi:hypothetical protein